MIITQTFLLEFLTNNLVRIFFIIFVLFTAAGCRTILFNRIFYFGTLPVNIVIMTAIRFVIFPATALIVINPCGILAPKPCVGLFGDKINSRPVSSIFANHMFQFILVSLVAKIFVLSFLHYAYSSYLQV